MFRHHRWSNLVLIDCLSTLTEEQLDLTVPGVYGSSMETIRHLISSDADYVRIIPDTPDVPQIDDVGPFGGWEELRSVAEAADTTLISYVDGLTEDMFFIDVDDGEAFDLTKSFLLGQIIHHATEHRSHIRTTLSAHGITPPEQRHRPHPELLAEIAHGEGFGPARIGKRDRGTQNPVSAQGDPAPRRRSGLHSHSGIPHSRLYRERLDLMDRSVSAGQVMETTDD